MAQIGGRHPLRRVVAGHATQHLLGSCAGLALQIEAKVGLPL